MPSKKELERRIEALEAQLTKQSVNKHFMFSSWSGISWLLCASHAEYYCIALGI